MNELISLHPQSWVNLALFAVHYGIGFFTNDTCNVVSIIMQPLCQECVCVAVHRQLSMFWLRLSLGDKKWLVDIFMQCKFNCQAGTGLC